MRPRAGGETEVGHIAFDARARGPCWCWEALGRPRVRGGAIRHQGGRRTPRTTHLGPTTTHNKHRVTDDDASGFTLADEAGTSVTEAGSSDPFTVVLAAQPAPSKADTEENRTLWDKVLAVFR